MATKEQYDYFCMLYEEEERTALELEGRAKVYLSIITAFNVAMLLKADEVQTSANTIGIPFWCLVVEAAILGLSLVAVVLALRVRKYEAINDGLQVLESVDFNLPENEIFFERCIADFAVASSRNRAVNNSTARLLAVASWLLVAGMIFLLGLITLSLGRVDFLS